MHFTNTSFQVADKLRSKIINAGDKIGLLKGHLFPFTQPVQGSDSCQQEGRSCHPFSFLPARLPTRMQQGAEQGISSADVCACRAAVGVVGGGVLYHSVSRTPQPPGQSSYTQRWGQMRPVTSPTPAVTHFYFWGLFCKMEIG